MPVEAVFSYLKATINDSSMNIDAINLIAQPRARHCRRLASDTKRFWWRGHTAQGLRAYFCRRSSRPRRSDAAGGRAKILCQVGACYTQCATAMCLDNPGRRCRVGCAEERRSLACSTCSGNCFGLVTSVLFQENPHWRRGNICKRYLVRPQHIRTRNM